VCIFFQINTNNWLVWNKDRKKFSIAIRGHARAFRFLRETGHHPPRCATTAWQAKSARDGRRRRANLHAGVPEGGSLPKHLSGLPRCSASLRLPTLGYTCVFPLGYALSRGCSLPVDFATLHPTGCLRQATQPAPAGMCSGFNPKSDLT